MGKTTKDLLSLATVTILLTLIVWLPHILSLQNFYGMDFSNGFNTIYRNFDGLEYIVIAKTFYNPGLIATIPQPQPVMYYGSHFPGYALLILTLSPMLGFLKSMLFVSMFFTILSCVAFYFFLKDFQLTNHPLWLSLVFLLLPARWLIVHSVGSSEPLFIFSIIMALYFFMKFNKENQARYIWLAAFAGALAQLTRPPAILLFFALSLYIGWKVFTQKDGPFLKRLVDATLKYFPVLLIPLTLMGIFYWFSITYGDFWAYFKTGDNIHLTFPPFQVFNKSQFWVGDVWLEDLIYIHLLSFLGGILLFKQKLYPLAFFVLVYSVATISIAHRDVSRYILPVAPFVLIAFEKLLIRKEFKIALAILALGIYLYAQNFILANVAPVPNLEVFN